MNFYQAGSKCEPCHPSCEACIGGDKKECTSCGEGFRYTSGECKSECPDGTYYDTIDAGCKICNYSSCSWCVKTPNTCVKCAPPLALDVSTLTCKPCCARSLRGKLKNPTCCNCPSSLNGFCLSSSSDDADTLINRIFKSDSSSDDDGFGWKSFIFLLFLVACLVLALYSVYFLRKSFKKSNRQHDNVKYTVLQENDN
jgi:hypothetical protein